jgi:ATP-dependent Lon protease
VIQNLKKAAANNPVFMLDEVHKLGADFRGDPSSALLEVLDPEQNSTFSDHYLEVAFDLSHVLFIATANMLDTIPPALLDRLELLRLPGYTEEEKIGIARRHLVPKQIKEHGLPAGHVRFSKKALSLIIRDYTRENGLRNLEREIANVCRKVAREIAETTKIADTTTLSKPKSKQKAKAKPKTKPLKVRTVDEADIRGFLGPERFYREVAERTSEPGVATGLAWTPVGGEVLFVEATRMDGSKSFTVTGQVGDVMRESAMAALSCVRSRADRLGIEAEVFATSDIHIHVPAGAVPKDGPSAGITMAVALVSLLTGRPVRPDVAMTGEITLRGKVLPVGGIKEKVLAARRAGVKSVVLPEKNSTDLEEIDATLRKELRFHFVSTIDDVLRHVFASKPAKKVQASERRRAPKPKARPKAKPDAKASRAQSPKSAHQTAG